MEKLEDSRELEVVEELEESEEIEGWEKPGQARELEEEAAESKDSEE